jgi:hypothetical protein
MAGTRTVRASRRTTSKALSYVTVNKFQGGITGQNDKVQIAMGFSPMARNVEWQREGGFYVRKGVGRLIYGGFGHEMAVPGAVPTRFYHYVRDPTSTTQFTSQYLVATEADKILVGVDYGAPLTADGSWLTMQAGAVDIVTVGSPAITAWDQNAYLSVGVQATTGLGLAMHRWDGATGTAMGKAWVNDIAAPTGGNMPAARYITAWAERMWLACTLPDSGMEPSMIRWSHPGRPEDWAEADYIRVGQAGDVITGIAPMRDMLVVFKRSSMYALLGSGSTNFRIVPLSGTVGCTGEFTIDNQGRVVFWDATQGLSRFDGKGIEHLFMPLAKFVEPGAGSAIHRCGGVVTDGDKIYVATDFVDYYGDRVPEPLTPLEAEPRAATPMVPGQTRWDQLTGNNITWAGTSGTRWMQGSVEFYTMVWVYREGCGFTSFTLANPLATSITMLGQIRSRLAASGDVESNRRVVYGMSNGAVPIYLSDRYDDGTDWWDASTHTAIDAFYMTPWLHGGLPAQIKRWKAPRIIQEADNVGILLVDVFYDFNYDFLRRTLRTGVLTALSFDSYLVGKPGTIGRAKAVMLVIRPEHPRHWGVSSITIPVHPKVMR